MESRAKNGTVLVALSSRRATGSAALCPCSLCKVQGTTTYLLAYFLLFLENAFTITRNPKDRFAFLRYELHVPCAT